MKMSGEKVGEVEKFMYLRSVLQKDGIFVDGLNMEKHQVFCIANECQLEIIIFFIKLKIIKLNLKNIKKIIRQ